MQLTKNKIEIRDIQIAQSRINTLPIGGDQSMDLEVATNSCRWPPSHVHQDKMLLTGDEEVSEWKADAEPGAAEMQGRLLAARRGAAQAKSSERGLMMFSTPARARRNTG
jgi:hypothetical protein